MTPTRLHHVVFAVNDLEEAAATWKRVFGLQVDDRLESEMIQAKLGFIHLGGSDAANGFLELAQPIAAQGPVAQALAERGESMLSASIEVADIDAAVAGLTEAGFPVSDVAAGPLPGTRVARIPAEATCGVRLQLIQRGSPATSDSRPATL